MEKTPLKLEITVIGWQFDYTTPFKKVDEIVRAFLERLERVGLTEANIGYASPNGCDIESSRFCIEGREAPDIIGSQLKKQPKKKTRKEKPSAPEAPEKSRVAPFFAQLAHGENGKKLDEHRARIANPGVGDENTGS